jgi:hypothetical protein
MTWTEPERDAGAQHDRGQDVREVEDHRVDHAPRHHDPERHPRAHQRPDPQRRSARSRGQDRERAELPDGNLAAADKPDPVRAVGEDTLKQEGVGGAGGQLQDQLDADPARRRMPETLA